MTIFMETVHACRKQKPIKMSRFTSKLLYHITTIIITPSQFWSLQKSFTQSSFGIRTPWSTDFLPCKFGVNFHEISDSQNTLETLATQTQYLYQLKDEN